MGHRLVVYSWGMYEVGLRRVRRQLRVVWDAPWIATRNSAGSAMHGGSGRGRKEEVLTSVLTMTDVRCWLLIC